MESGLVGQVATGTNGQVGPTRADRPRRRVSARVLRRVATPLVLLGVWHVGSTSGLISERTLASPGTIASTFGDLLSSGQLVEHMTVSLQRAAYGLGLGVLTGTALALVAGLSRLGEDLVDPPLQMARTLPVLGLVPLFILWFGIGETAKVLMVALATTFPVYLNTFAGIRGVDQRLVEAASTLGLRRAGLVRHVVLPAALPHFLVGLRYSLGIAWLVLVVSEQINASSGLGYLMTRAREFMQTDVIVVALVVYAALGLLSDLAVRTLERSALAWRPTFAGT
jgi:sulfonate transport system permease protein